ncbi:hypothetical protein HMPREF9123_2365 [Neisseria bacilliformis ATCC BAA-1200]|uniref:Uncharacterized protein n=1 Tax=Neisseria bacilliformis ATCC BAA-1200 TaxID=888742 RepID=F2BF58_9NEIS|nr:hypothetical protein HMPREF9123_2365 [Neisseria bacilliformis ATCC BAA-1200]
MKGRLKARLKHISFPCGRKPRASPWGGTPYLMRCLWWCFTVKGCLKTVLAAPKLRFQTA